MNKRIRKKHLTKKRNASRKLILSMNDGFDKDRMLMLHVIRFGDDGFFHEVIGPDRRYIVMPSSMGRTLVHDMIAELIMRAKV